MSEFRDQNDAKMAMRGRMGLMTGSILLLFTAISSSLMYGINFLAIAIEAANGTEEYTELLADANLSISMTQAIGIIFVVLTVIEVGIGIHCFVFCNRLDKAGRSKKVTIALLAVEILMQVFLFFAGVPNLSMLFTSLIIPGYMLWGAAKLCKLAKLYPDRIHATNTRRMREKEKEKEKGKAAASQTPKKSLRDRAVINSKLQWDEMTEAADDGDDNSSGAAEPLQEESAKSEAADAGAGED